MLTSPSSSPLVSGMSSVPDFPFAIQSLAQPFPALTLSKPLASISIPQPLARLPPQMPSSLYVPTTAPDVVKKQASRCGLKGVRRHTPSNDKVKKRLARKAELARASRRRKKAYIQDLEDKVNRLSQQVLQLQRERALLGLGPPPASLAFPPITISPRNNSSGGKHSDGEYSSDEVPTHAPYPQVDSDCNGVILDGLSGLATAASSLAPIETAPDTVPSGESKNSNSVSKLEEPNCEKDKVNSVAKPTRLQPGLFRLSPSAPSMPRSLNSSSTNQPLTNQSPQSPSALLSSSRLSAFTDTRQGKSDPIERCIKATYKGDTRRFSLSVNNFTYSTLLQTLRETYQNLPPTFTVKYCDEEDDLINITTTAEFKEAYRLLCLSPFDSSDPISISPSQKILKLLIEDSSTTTNARRSTSSKSQSSKKKVQKRKKSPSSTSSPSESSRSPSSKKRKSGQVGREIPLPPLFPTSSFPIFFQGLETKTSDETIVPCCLIVDASMTIAQMKNDIAKLHPPPPGISYQYSFQNQILDDNFRLVKDYGILKGSIISLDRVETHPPPPLLPSIPIPSVVPSTETVSVAHLPSFSLPSGIEHSTQTQIQDSTSTKNRIQNKNSSAKKLSNSTVSQEQEQHTCSALLVGSKKFTSLLDTTVPLVLGA